MDDGAPQPSFSEPDTNKEPERSAHTDAIDVVDTPSILCWVTESGQTFHLSKRVDASFHLDSTSGTSFFRFRVPVGLKALPNETALSFTVSPENVQTLAFDDEFAGTPEAAQLARVELRSHTDRLRFELVRPATLIVPKVPLTPKRRAAGQVLDAIRSLAKSTTFAVYIKNRVMSRAQLQRLCQSVSGARLQTMVKYADLAPLYGGNGGKALVDDALAAFLQAGPADAATAATVSGDALLPSYDEVQHDPPTSQGFLHSGSPAYFQEHKSNKRPRSDSDELLSGKSIKKNDTSMIGDQIVACIAAQFRQTEARMVQHLDRRFEAQEKRYDERSRRQQDRLMEHIQQRLQELETRLDARFSKATGVQAQDFDLQLADVEWRTTKHVEFEVDDKMDGLKDEMRGFVRDEMEEAKGDMRDYVHKEMDEAKEAIEEARMDMEAELREGIGEATQDVLEVVSNAGVSLQLHF